MSNNKDKALELMEGVIDSIECRVFGINKAKSKTENPAHRVLLEAALHNLEEKLVELALDELF